MLLAGGLGVFSLLGSDLNYAALWGGVVVFAAGMALASAPATTAIVSSLPAGKQGVASAVNDVSREWCIRSPSRRPAVAGAQLSPFPRMAGLNRHWSRA